MCTRLFTHVLWPALWQNATAERIKNMPSDDWRQHDPEFQMPRLERNLKLVSALTEIGKRHSVNRVRSQLLGHSAILLLLRR